ncbi:MAG: hypothetical protein R3A44_22945 [Caldilineaceae bacterium]
MTQATITLSGAGIQDIHNLNVQIAIEATVHVDAQTSRRRATAWLASEVGNMLIAGAPQLVIAEKTVWRLPVLLTSSHSGTIGKVGTVDVDTMTGELAVNEDLKNRILANVQQLISPSLSPAG